jgi:hypothetical protein
MEPGEGPSFPRATVALFDGGPEHAEFALRSKQAPRSGEIIPPAAAFLGLVLLPHLEKLLRGTHVRGWTD